MPEDTFYQIRTHINKVWRGSIEQSKCTPSKPSNDIYLNSYFVYFWVYRLLNL